MEPAEIFNQFVADGPLPVEALRAATLNRTAMVPLFIDAIERYIAGDPDPSLEDRLFLAFHLLGEWRETSAYPVLARLLRQADIDALLSDAVTETIHRVMAAVFDGDPEPLYSVILDPEADEFVRSCLCEVVAMVTQRHLLPREEARRFLTACYEDLPQEECFVWNGWQYAIAMLGLDEMTPLVEQAFKKGHISRMWMSFSHFQDDLRNWKADPSGASAANHGDFSLFGDTVEELSTWHCFSEQSIEKHPPKSAEPIETRRPPLGSLGFGPQAPVVNPLRHVGRNDPGPCGSGKKLKKCCLNAPVETLTA